MLDRLTREDFLPHVEETFTIEHEEGTLGTRLVEVSRMGEENKGAPRQTFSVIFRGPRDAYLEQSTYKVSNDKMGELELFLVPIGNDEEGMCFEAVFN